MIISDVFEIQETAATIENRITQYERGLGVDVSFRCTVEPSQQAQSGRLQQTVAAFSQRGLSIDQVRRAGSR
jgi:hypothetical protein